MLAKEVLIFVAFFDILFLLMFSFLKLTSTIKNQLNFVANPALIVSNVIFLSRKWNVTLLNDLVLSTHIVHLILGIYPTPYVPCWGFTSSGEFSVGTTIWLAHGIKTTTIPLHFNWIWKNNESPKVQIFLSQCLQNGLPLKLNLVNRQITNDALCSLCKSDNETLNHLFFTCSTIGHYLNSNSIRPKTRHIVPQDLVQSLASLCNCSVTICGAFGRNAIQ